MAEADDNKPAGGHNLADHLLGENLAHEHDEYTDHDHDHFEFDDDGPQDLRGREMRRVFQALTRGSDRAAALIAVA